VCRFIRYDVEDDIQAGVVFCLRIMWFQTDEEGPNWSMPDMLRETAKEIGDVRKNMGVGLAVVPTRRKYGGYRSIALLDNILDAWLDDFSETEVLVAQNPIMTLILQDVELAAPGRLQRTV
jgi:hypothetical protein